MFRDGKAAISPSEGPVNKSKLCLCSWNTFNSSVFVCVAFLCDSWHCSRSFSKSFLSAGVAIGPTSSVSSFSFCLSSSNILARDAKISSTLEPTFVSSSMLVSTPFKELSSFFRDSLFCLTTAGRVSYPSGSSKSSMCRSPKALLNS